MPIASSFIFLPSHEPSFDGTDVGVGDGATVGVDVGDDVLFGLGVLVGTSVGTVELFGATVCDGSEAVAVSNGSFDGLSHATNTVIKAMQINIESIFFNINYPPQKST